MYTDPIADLLTRIRNAQSARKYTITVGHSKQKENILTVMKENDFIESYDIAETGKGKKEITINLRTDITQLNLRRDSKPGQRIYRKADELREVRNGLGIQIVSTSAGFMTSKEAHDKNMGGEIICTIY